MTVVALFDCLFIPLSYSKIRRGVHTGHKALCPVCDREQAEKARRAVEKRLAELETSEPSVSGE